MVIVLFQVCWILGWITSMLILFKPMVWDKNIHKMYALCLIPVWMIQLLLGWFIILPMYLWTTKRENKGDGSR